MMTDFLFMDEIAEFIKPESAAAFIQEGYVYRGIFYAVYGSFRLYEC